MKNVQSYSYHCHTNFSDGKNNLSEMVLQAQKIGFTELGISDHLIVHKDFNHSMSIPYMRKRNDAEIYNCGFSEILEKYKRHCENIRKLSQKIGLKLYVGFEVDFFTYDGWLEELKEFLRQIDYDYLISGNHMLFDENGLNVFDLNDLPEICTDKSLCAEYLRRHFMTINESVKSGLFKFLAHLDYARKLGDDFCGAQDFKQEKLSIVDSLEKYGIGTEISTKGLRKINDFYPCDWLLKEIADRNINVVISDDAHRVSEVGEDFDVAEEALKKYNITRRLHI